MKRRIIALLLSAVMLMTAVSALAMTPGTYTGVAKGMFDGLTVEVTVTEDAITDIKVTYKAADSAAQAASAEPALMTMSAGEAAEESIFLVSRDIGQMALASMMAVQEPEVPTEPEEPTEPEIFTPGLLTMKVNKTSARVGQKVQVTITTSADVRYLTINGQKLTAYKNIHGGYTRSWTVTLTAKEAGEMEIAVVAYDSKDVASEAVTTIVKVTAKNWINGKF